ncbi:MAG TPA: MFS transporter [Syntrophorhabdaceae bacterium]|nr:MFS transporter [Syntrophorhabdaceae bacterium]
MKKLSAGETNHYRWWVLVTVSIVSFTVSLDNSILAACLPRLAQVFHTDPLTIGWLTIAFLITSQSLMLSLSRIGDARGRKMVYMVSLALYTLGLACCSLSQGIGQLIAARAMQGIGAATIFSLSMAIGVAVFPAEERGRTLGILASVYSVGLVAGPVFGGFLLDLIGWRAVFYSRIPIALCGLAMTWMIIKEQKSEDAHFRFDAHGTIGLFGLLSCLTLCLTFGSKRGFGTTSVLVLAILSVLFVFYFLRAEMRAEQPVIDIKIFRERLFAAATLTNMVYAVSSSMAIFLIPFFLMEGLRSSGSLVGVFMGLMAAPVVLIAPVSGKLSDKIGSRFLSALGVFINCVGLFYLSRMGAGCTLIALGVGVILVGSGMGIFQPPNNSLIVGSVPAHMLGTASAVALTARQIGVSLGITIAGAVFTGNQAYQATRLMEKGFDVLSAKILGVTASFSEALILGAAIGVIGIFTSLVRKSRS